MDEFGIDDNEYYSYGYALCGLRLHAMRPGDRKMDNASFHKNKKIRELIEAAGCQLVFLPVRSPDLNPIENFWSPIKNAIRQLLEPFERDLMKCVEHLYQNNITEIC